jgi:hypothetical protein
MTDLEFDILDELYFVISFEELMQKLGIEETKLKTAMQTMLEQKYIKCFRNVSDELPNEHLDFKELFFKLTSHY